MNITWLGHSCFLIESGGYTIITDPYKDGAVPGLNPVRADADYVFCSHDHDDHNAEELVKIRKNESSHPFSFKFIDIFHGTPGRSRLQKHCNSPVDKINNNVL